jgi:hypothetical protein
MKWRGSSVSMLDRPLHRATGSVVSSEQLAFRRAAALLPKFDPARLRSVGDLGRDKGALFYLFKDSTVLGEPGRSLWVLKPEVRRQTLASMRGPADVKDSLEANPDAQAPAFAETIRRYLSGSMDLLDAQSPEQLTQTLQAVRWLSLVPGVPDIPTETDVLAEIERKALFDPFRRLVREGFVGRQAELDQLREFVGVLAPKLLLSRMKALGSRIGHWFQTMEAAPLLVYGPGGIGKSTLIAQFIIEHFEVPPDYRFPFAYLDFERPTITALEPMTLVIEAIRQLKLQYPHLRDELTRLSDRARSEAIRQSSDENRLREIRELDISAEKARERADRIRTNRLRRERLLFKRLAKLLRRAGGKREAPFLLILDSFERTQYRSYLHLGRIWRLFEALQRAYPLLRIVVSGRAPVKGLKIKRREPIPLPIREFGQTAAAEFLVHRSRSAFDSRVARSLVAEYGGNPLTLTLLAKIGKEQPLDQAEPKKSWTDFWSRTRNHYDRTLIQAFLYERLLGQISNKEILPLANPGLVLRRITPEIIQEILAPYCKLDVPTRVRAEHLFSELERHVDLVERLEPGVLGHRPEVRTMMLKLLAKDQGPMVTAIENAAVKFYTGKSGPQARAEEIYHRLRLGEPLATVEPRWEPGVDRYLGEDAIAEIPESARPFLASKLGSIALNGFTGERTEDQPYLEAKIARNAVDLLADGHFEEALELIDEHDTSWSVASPLHVVRAEALIGLDREKEASGFVDQVIISLENHWRGSPESSEGRDVLLALDRIAARLASSKGEWENADLHLARSFDLAAGPELGLMRLQILLGRVRARTMASSTVDEESNRIRRVLAGEFLETSASEMSTYPTLVTAIGSEIGVDDARVLKRAIEILDWSGGFRHIDHLSEELSALSDGSESWRNWLKDFSRSHGFTCERSDASAMRTLLAELYRAGKFPTFLAALAERSEDGSSLRRALAEVVASSGWFSKGEDE